MVTSLWQRAALLSVRNLSQRICQSVAGYARRSDNALGAPQMAVHIRRAMKTIAYRRSLRRIYHQEVR
ncbi:hypothetical protein BD309DRAFT_960655 [Dichomitus squalens]|nr:hypothetical protein BD309DRAFT_960655 [Dichomitus squalens]